MDSDSASVDWSQALGRTLYVIGLYSPENFDIAVDENGAVYFLGEYLWCVGKNLYKGLEAIIRIDQWSQIQFNDEDNYWVNPKGEKVDFNTYEFKYKYF